MTSEVLTQSVAAGATVTFSRGRIFNLLQASSPVTITLETKSVKGGQTSIRKFVNIPAGSKFTLKAGEEDWTFLRLFSSVLQSVTLFVGDDDMTFNNAVTVTGVAQVTTTPNSAFNAGPIADGNIASGNAASIPANVARRAITVSSPPTNTGTVYIQHTGDGAGPHGIPLQPGTFVTLTTTSAFDVRNDSGAAQYITYNEET